MTTTMTTSSSSSCSISSSSSSVSDPSSSCLYSCFEQFLLDRYPLRKVHSQRNSCVFDNHDTRIYHFICTLTDQEVAVKRVTQTGIECHKKAMSMEQAFAARHQQSCTQPIQRMLYISDCHYKQMDYYIEMFPWYSCDLYEWIRRVRRQAWSTTKTSTCLLKGGPSMIQWILWNILSGVAYLNELGFAHGDLKAGNVFLRDSSYSTSQAFPDVHVGDFGSVIQGLRSPSSDLLLLPSGVTTTLQYCAPEMLLDSFYPSSKKLPGLTSQIDVWSIGCILAEWYLRTMLFPCPFTKDKDDPCLASSQRKQFRYLWKSLGASFFIPRASIPSRASCDLQRAYASCVTDDHSEESQSCSGPRTGDALLPEPLHPSSSSSSSSSSVKSVLSGLLFELHQIDSDVEELLMHMLTPFPDERWTISRCLKHQWFDPVRTYLTSSSCCSSSSSNQSTPTTSSSSEDVSMSDSPC